MLLCVSTAPILCRHRRLPVLHPLEASPASIGTPRTQRQQNDFLPSQARAEEYLGVDMPAYEILAIVGFVLHAAVAIAALVSLHRALDSLTLGSAVFWFAFIGGTRLVRVRQTFQQTQAHALTGSFRFPPNH